MAFLVLFWRYYDVYKVKYKESPLAQINELAGDDYTGDVVIYAPSMMEDGYDWSLLLHFGMYKFRSEYVTVTDFNEANLDAYLSSFSHFYIYEVDDQLSQYLHGRGWEGEVVPGMYETAEFAK